MRSNAKKPSKDDRKAFIKRWRDLIDEVDTREMAEVLVDHLLENRYFEGAVARLAQDTQMTVDKAVGVIQKDYYSDVKGVAKSLKDEIDAGEIADAEALQERLHEDIDGTQRVKYTFQSRLGLIATSNEDAYIDAFGAEGLVEGTVIQWERMMFAAMEQDVQEELERMGVDVNDPAPAEDDEDDDED